jgi:hypothetical protein
MRLGGHRAEDVSKKCSFQAKRMASVPTNGELRTEN